MPTSWGRGKTALLVGPDGGAVAGISDALKGVGFRVVRSPRRVSLEALLDDEHVHVVYLDAEVLEQAVLLARKLRETHPEILSILCKTNPAATDVADAMRAGVADFVPAGAAPATLLARLHDVIDERRETTAPVDGSERGPGGLTGSSPSMQRVYKMIERVARFKTSVLVLGESGTGKELVARALHVAGARRAHAFVPVNCATLGKELLENELFGHERGAFTGAHAQKAGLFEVANGGTLFLDEIGEMDVSTQAKLLRVLERAEFRRVGGTKKLKVDVSVVAATNRDLRTAIATGRFREDLYYRLKVVTISVPPLRERREDIPALVEAFITELNARHGARIRGVTAEAMRKLMDYAWPGNVRELKNVVDSAVMLAEGDLLDDRLIDEAVGASSGGSASAMRRQQANRSHVIAATPSELRISLPARLTDIEREVILQTVRTAPGRKAAARALGIGLRTLYAKLREFGVSGDGA